MKTMEISFYTFEELSRKSQKNAVENHRNEVFEEQYEDKKSEIVSDVIKYFENNGIRGFSIDSFSFDKNFKMNPVSDIKLSVHGSFFIENRFYGIDKDSDVKNYTFDINFSYDISNGVKISCSDDYGKSEMFDMCPFLEGYIGSTIKIDIEKNIENAAKFIKSDANVEYFLSKKDKYYHEDGSDISEFEMSFIK